MTEDESIGFDAVVAGIKDEMEGTDERIEALKAMDGLGLGRAFVLQDTEATEDAPEQGRLIVPDVYALPMSQGRDRHFLFGADGRMLTLESPRDRAESRAYDEIFDFSTGAPVSTIAGPATPLFYRANRPLNASDLYSFFGAGENPQHRWVVRDSRGQTDVRYMQADATRALNTAFELKGLPRDDLARIAATNTVMKAYFGKSSS